MEQQTQASETAATPPTASRLDSFTGKVATDALLLGILSAAGYCIAFAYESGYAKHFGYPTYLVSPTPTVIATAVAATLLIVIGLAMPIVEALESVDASRRRRAITIGGWIFSILMIGSILLDGNFETKAWITASLSALAIVGMNWASKKDVRDGMATGRHGFGLSLMGLLLIVIYTLANLAGLASAMNQQVFFFLPGKPDFAIVRLYDNTAIGVRYNFEGKKFYGEYQILKLENEAQLKLERVVLKGNRLPVFKDE